MKATIFELSQEYRELFQAMCDGEPDILTKLAFDASKQKLEDKIEAYAVMMNQFKSNIKTRKENIEDLKAKNEREEKAIEYLKSTLIGTIKAFGVKRLTPTNLEAFDFVAVNMKATSSPNQSVDLLEDFENDNYGGYKVEITNLKKVDVDRISKELEHKPMKAVFQADKEAISNDLKEGVVIDGAKFKVGYGIKVTLK
jgi:hypothetical protein